MSIEDEVAEYVLFIVEVEGEDLVKIFHSPNPNEIRFVSVTRSQFLLHSDEDGFLPFRFHGGPYPVTHASLNESEYLKFVSGVFGLPKGWEPLVDLTPKLSERAMSIEVGVVIGEGYLPIHWHLPVGSTAGSLPDSLSLWDVLWNNRSTVVGFAHSHPGGGDPHPSSEDLTTFSAIELALGRRLTWWIASEDGFAAFRWQGPEAYQYKGYLIADTAEPLWVRALRDRSCYRLPPGKLLSVSVTPEGEQYSDLLGEI